MKEIMKTFKTTVPWRGRSCVYECRGEDWGVLLDRWDLRKTGPACSLEAATEMMGLCRTNSM